MDEFRLIKAISRRARHPVAGVRTGIGDDAAVVRPPAGQDVVLTTDTQIEGIHFQWAWISAVDLGFRAAMACLSDLAAMGAKPWLMLSSLALPSKWSRSDVLSVQRGLDRALQQTGTALVGGNVSASRNGFSIHLTALGTVPCRQAVLRHGVRVGDRIWVSGYPGSASLGIEQLKAGRTRSRFILAYRRPEARLALGQALRRSGLVSAMIDISDGVAGDLGHMLGNRSGARLYREALPRADGFLRACRYHHLDPLEPALHGGEDYELLFTTPNDLSRQRVRSLERAAGTSIRSIGVVELRPGIRVQDHNGRVRTVKPEGFRHRLGTT